MELEREELKHRLAAGESLEICTGEGSYEVWGEPYANPPVLFYEGRPVPYNALERVVSMILTALRRGEVSCRWVEPHGVQMKGCEEAYRRSAAET